MLRMTAGRLVSYLLTAWFITVFVLITAAGVGFVGTMAYHLFF